MADLYTNTMYYWRHIISLFCILQTYHADGDLTKPSQDYDAITITFSIQGATIQTSRACFGISGLFCTLHNISCSCSRRITISDAYYTNTTECGIHGLSSCATVNPDNITEHGYLKFNDTELLPLYNICSTKTQCVYPAPRRGAFHVFSVVKYQCIERITTDGPNTGATEGSTSTPASSQFPGITTDGPNTGATEGSTSTPASSQFPGITTDGPNTGATEGSTSTPASSQFSVGVFIGGAGAGGVVVALAVIAGYFLILRRRYDITTKTPAPSLPFTDHPTYTDLSARVDVNNYAVMGQPSISPEDATLDASLPASDYQTI